MALKKYLLHELTASKTGLTMSSSNLHRTQNKKYTYSQV
jgi:hypothetical protein